MSVFLMYEAFYAKLQLRETFIIIPQKPDLHQKFGAIVMELSFSPSQFLQKKPLRCQVPVTTCVK